ncbi:MAG: PAS domain S-box protein [Bacteroidia bacterium]|nr:PAS domain S-box protein [Bacteroidia bacterium]
MNSQKDYEKLLQDYHDLQLRVTQFSNIEQQLINTQDKLDSELLLYKRLQKFNTQALKEYSKQNLVRLITESVIDILEIESSLVYFKDHEDATHSLLLEEGLSIDYFNKPNYIEDLELLCNNKPLGKATILSADVFIKYATFKNFSSGLFFHYYEKELGYSFCILGLISIEKAPIYDQLQSKHETIFSILSHQVQSLFANREKNDKIKEQIIKISESEVELKKLSLIATKTKNGVIITDNKGRIEWVNDAFSAISGYALDELKGKKPKDFLHGSKTDPAALKLLSNALSKKENVELTLINHSKSGRTYYNQLEITPVFDSNGNHINFISLQKDITEEILSKQQLIRINTRFELITTKSQIGVWEWEAETNKLVWNDVFLKQYGIASHKNSNSLEGFWEKSVHPEDWNEVNTKKTELINSEDDILECEYRIIKNDTGEVRIVRDNTIAERDENGKLLRLIGSSIDITEERLNKLQLQQNLKQQELLSEVSLGLNNLTDFDSRINFVLNQIGKHMNVSRVYVFENTENSAYCSNTYEWCNKNVLPQIEELQNIPYEIIPSFKPLLVEHGFIYSDDISLLPEDLKAVLEPQVIKSLIIYPLYVNGLYYGYIGFDECFTHKKWSKLELELLKTISGIVSNAFERDISQKVLIASEKKYRGIIENINIGLIESNLGGEIVFKNQKFVELTLIEDSTLLLISGDMEGDLKQKLEKEIILSYTKIGQSVYEIDIKRPDNKIVTLLISIAPAINQLGDISGFINAFLDITSVKVLQKNLEVALVERDSFIEKTNSVKLFYESILDHSPAKIAVISPDLVFSYVNELMIYREPVMANAMGKSIMELAALHPIESERLNKLTSIINEAIENKKLIQFEESRNVKQDEEDKELVILRSILPYYRVDNTLEYIIITGVDITNLKNIEKSVLKKNEELKKINTELDNFVYSVSHDLRSPLLSIKGIMELILKTTVLDEKTTNYLTLAQNSTSRLDGTIREILEYSKNARFDVELELFDVQEMVQQIYDDLKFTDNLAVKFVIDIQGSPIVYSDKKRFNTLLKNLIGNSVKYKRKEINDSFVKFALNRKNDSIFMQVIDNGMGISDLSIGKVFDMFYRGTKLSAGTGLGLYICKEIVNKLNGEISLHSKLDVGTTIDIIIPKLNSKILV